MNGSCWQNDHVWEYALHVYTTGEDGVKNVAKKLGLGWSGLALRVQQRGIPRKMHASTRRKLSGCRAATELRNKWQRLLKRMRRPLKTRKRGISQMARYYANHAEYKERGRISAAKRYGKLRLTGEYRIKVSCRNAVTRIARMVGSRRKPKTRTHEYLGCDYPTARAHIETQFKAGMCWANHGTAWEIDHRRPLASFDLRDDVQLRVATHYTNLQPLWKQDNRKKGASWIQSHDQG